MNTLAQPAAHAPRRVRTSRLATASMIGTSLEWYDFTIYNTLAALVFNHLFFPSVDPLAGTILAFSTHAVGYVSRPLGGFVFGNLGDRIGRRAVLMLTLVLMGVTTALMGALPTYAQAGILARSCSSRCASCRASRSAANGPARCCCRSSTATRSGAGCPHHGRRSARRSARCSAPAASRS